MRLRFLVAALIFAGACQCWNPNAQYGTALYLIVDLDKLPWMPK